MSYVVVFTDLLLCQLNFQCTSWIVFFSKFKNIFYSHFYSLLIQKHTRITEQSATLIDNSSNSAADILKVSISDHYANFCILKYDTIQDKTKIVKKNSVIKILPYLIHDLTNKIGTVNCDCDCDCECAQSAFSQFQSVIDMHFSAVFKMQTHTIHYKNRHPWMTDALRAQINLKT